MSLSGYLITGVNLLSKNKSKRMTSQETHREIAAPDGQIYFDAVLNLDVSHLTGRQLTLVLSIVYTRSYDDFSVSRLSECLFITTMVCIYSQWTCSVHDIHSNDFF